MERGLLFTFSIRWRRETSYHLQREKDIYSGDTGKTSQNSKELTVPPVSSWGYPFPQSCWYRQGIHRQMIRMTGCLLQGLATPPNPVERKLLQELHPKLNRQQRIRNQKLLLTLSKNGGNEKPASVIPRATQATGNLKTL